MSRLRGIAGIIALIVLLVGCGTTGSTPGSTSPLASTPTATPALTATPVPTTPTGNIVSSCFGPSVSPSQVTQSGDFLLTPVTVDGLAYPSVMLPDGTPTNKPYKLTADGRQAYTADFPNSPVTNPALKEPFGGFVLSVCNISTTKAHVLRGVSAKITGFTAYSGQLNSWQVCDSTLSSHHQLGGGGCGGGVAGCDCFHAVFSNTGVGAVVAMTQTDSSLINPGDNLAKLPFSLAPGKTVTLTLGMDTPPSGEYTFAFGLSFDGAGPIFSASSPNTLLAPVAHKWTGFACQQPAMEAQITPTNPETYYICAQ